MLPFLLCFSVLLNVVSSNKYPTIRTEDSQPGSYHNAVNSAKLINLVQKFGNDAEIIQDAEMEADNQGTNVTSTEDTNIYETMKLIQKNNENNHFQKDEPINHAQFHFLKNPDVLEKYRNYARRNRDYIDSTEDQKRSYFKEAMRSGRLVIHNLKSDIKNRYNRKYNIDSLISSSDERLAENDDDNSQSDDLIRYTAFRANGETANEVTLENTANDNFNDKTADNNENTAYANNNDSKENKKSYGKPLNDAINTEENSSNMDKNKDSVIIINNGNYNTANENGFKSPETLHIVKPFLRKVLNKLHEKSNAIIESVKNSQNINSENDYTNHEEVRSERDINNKEEIFSEKEVDIQEERMVHSDTSAELPRNENPGSKFNNLWPQQTSKTDSVESKQNDDMHSHVFKDNGKKGSLPQNYYFKDSSEYIDKHTNEGLSKYEKTNDFGKSIENINTDVKLNLFETKTTYKDTYTKGKNNDWTYDKSHKKVNNWQNKEIDDIDKENSNLATNDRWKKEDNRWSKEKLQNSKHNDSRTKHDSQEEWVQNADQQNKKSDWGRKTDTWNAFYSQKMYKKRKEMAKNVEVDRAPDYLNKKNYNLNGKEENLNKHISKYDDWNINEKDLKKPDNFNKKQDGWNRKKEDINKNLPKNYDWSNNDAKKSDNNNKNTDWNLDTFNKQKHDQNTKWHENDKKGDDLKRKDNIWNKKDNDWNKKDDSWNKKDNDWNKKDDDWDNKESWSNKQIDWNNKDFIVNKEVKKEPYLKNKHNLRDLVSEDDMSGAREVKTPKFNPFDMKKDKNSDWSNYNIYKGKKIWGGSPEVKQIIKDKEKDILPSVNKNWNSYVAHIGEERPRKTYRNSGEKRKPMNIPFGRTPIPFMKKKSIYM